VDLFETCEITLTPGIIDTQAPEKIISVLNCGDQHVTIYPKHTISASPPIQQGISIVSKQRQSFL
jgi:hypothetical protein